MPDTDFNVEWVFKKTLFLWLFPYILWFFGKKIYAFVYEWVTEPESAGNG